MLTRKPEIDSLNNKITKLEDTSEQRNLTKEEQKELRNLKDELYGLLQELVRCSIYGVQTIKKTTMKNIETQIGGN